MCTVSNAFFPWTPWLFFALLCVCVRALFFNQGVIPRYGEVLDEMATGACVALEVRQRKRRIVGSLSDHFPETKLLLSSYLFL